jgi:hypothetical protein
MWPNTAPLICNIYRSTLDNENVAVFRCSPGEQSVKILCHSSTFVGTFIVNGSNTILFLYWNIFGKLGADNNPETVCTGTGGVRITQNYSFATGSVVYGTSSQDSLSLVEIPIS